MKHTPIVFSPELGLSGQFSYNMDAKVTIMPYRLHNLPVNKHSKYCMFWVIDCLSHESIHAVLHKHMGRKACANIDNYRAERYTKRDRTGLFLK